jgi:predicted CXXCH cytochrome family protein
MPLSSLYAKIQVISPVDNSYTENRSLTIIGAELSDDEKREVIISITGMANGEPEKITEEVDIYDREFSLEVDLYEGENTITVGEKSFSVFYSADGAVPPPKRYKKYNYHAAALSGCSDCHDTETEGFPLTADKTKICIECHPQYMMIEVIRPKKRTDKKAAGEGVIIFENLHKPVFEGKCLLCHMPHSSPNRRLLTKEQVFFLCEDCHREIFDALNLAENPHPPQADGECVRCHSPHASEEKYLFKGPLTYICFNCHNNFLVDADGYEKKSRHKPARLGLCYECHDLHFGDELKLTNKSDIRKKCLECHEGKQTAKHIDMEKACITCHNPHSSDFNDLLINSEIGVCEKCHDAILKGKVVHEAMKKPCTYCHGSLHDLKNIDDVKKNCYECHTDKEHIKVAHNDYDIPLEKCSTCHNPHSASGEGLIDAKQHMPFFEGDCGSCHEDVGGEITLTREGSYLCYQCHDSKEIFNGKVLLQNMHTPVRTGMCTSCHNPHASDNKKLLITSEREICLECHKNKILGRGFKKFDFLHAPLEEGGCGSCHKSHGSSVANNLNEDVKTICFSCHEGLYKRGKSAKTVHPPYGEKKCTLCHSPHGSDFEKLLIKNQAALCYSCHEHLTSSKMNIPYKVIHEPVRDGECSKCHDPHFATSKKLVIAEGNALCLNCHKDLNKKHHPLKYVSAKKSVVIEKGFLKDGDDFLCIGCHHPHAANNNNLFPSADDLFCRRCHKQGDAFGKEN